MLSFDLCPYDCHSYIMHRFMTYCLFVTQLISQLPPSFTVSVCASYRGRGLGSTLCKSLVTHVASCYKLVGCHCVYMYEQRMNHVSLKKRQSHQLRRACFNQCVPVAYYRISPARKLVRVAGFIHMVGLEGTKRLLL